MGLQDDRMSGNIQDIARLITRLLLQGDMPQYTLPAAEADYTEADQLFSKIMGLADEGDINGAENELLMNMEDNDPEYLELALTFYLYLNDMEPSPEGLFSTSESRNFRFSEDQYIFR